LASGEGGRGGIGQFAIVDLVLCGRFEGSIGRGGRERRRQCEGWDSRTALRRVDLHVLWTWSIGIVVALRHLSVDN
jgi:hypothetical protein